MKKLSLLLCLLTSAAPVLAAWTAFSDTELSTHYIDKSTVRKEGGLTKVWIMEDLRKPAKKGELSRRARFTFDCEKELFETLTIAGFAGHKLSGELIYTEKLPVNWLEIPPESISANIMKRICP